MTSGKSTTTGKVHVPLFVSGAMAFFESANSFTRFQTAYVVFEVAACTLFVFPATI